MSLDRKSIHVRILPDMYDRLAVLAGLQNSDVAEHAAYLLEKMIVADFYSVSLQADKFRRLGMTGIAGDSRGVAGSGRP
jgi:hypothetical protein